MSNGKKKKNGNSQIRDNDSPSAWKSMRIKTEETRKIYETDPTYKPKVYLTPESWIVALGLISFYVGFTVGFILRNTLYTIH